MAVLRAQCAASDKASKPLNKKDLSFLHGPVNFVRLSVGEWKEILGGTMRRISNVAFILSFVALSACGLPVNQLTAKDRKTDMQWAFTLFDHNYAPAELKKDHFGVEMSQVEADCTAMAEQDMDNQAFLSLFQKCIHTFKDAHVGAQQMNNGILPEYAQVAHLGFLTMRTKTMVDGKKADALRIVSLLKGSEGPGAPLVPGDVIIGINGQSVDHHLKEEIIPYINVGQDETNLTVAAFRFGVRTSIDMALPEAEDIELVVARGPMVFNISIPWIKQDMLAFQLKQNPPKEKKPGETAPAQTDSASIMASSSEMQSIDDLIADYQTGVRPAKIAGLDMNPLAQTFFGYGEIKNLLSQFDNPIEFITNRVKWIALTGYRMAKFNPILHSLFEQGLGEPQSLKSSLQDRELPMSNTVEDLMSDPLITAKQVTTKDGKQYAYIQLKSFPAEDKILTEWYRMITAIEDKGIKSVIIDLIDNGGGSLVHGMRMVNMLRKKPLQFPSMQVRLNNNWIYSFKSQAAFAGDDYQKAIAARVVKKLDEDLAAGKRISRPISVKVMDPFFLQNPTIGLSDDVKVAILVNEMCVSMCDIFSSVFQENKLGAVIGQRTMGGGGNVVQHGLSPVTKMGMALTESLMITSGGAYIEDAGVTPETYVDMVADREKGFSAALAKAFEYVMDEN